MNAQKNKHVTQSIYTTTQHHEMKNYCHNKLATCNINKHPKKSKKHWQESKYLGLTTSPIHFSSTNTPRTLFFLCEISHYCKILDFFWVANSTILEEIYQNQKNKTLKVTLFIYMVQVSSQNYITILEKIPFIFNSQIWLCKLMITTLVTSQNWENCKLKKQNINAKVFFKKLPRNKSKI